MSRHIENHEILDRVLEIFSKSTKSKTKRITPRETRQNLLLTAPIMISATIFTYGDITIETTSTLKLSMAKLKRFWPFFAIFLF